MFFKLHEIMLLPINNIHEKNNMKRSFSIRMLCKITLKNEQEEAFS